MKHGVKHSSTELTPQFSELAFKAPLYCSLEGQSLSIFNPTLGLLTYPRNGTEETNTPTTSSTATVMGQFALASFGKVPKLIGTILRTVIAITLEG